MHDDILSRLWKAPSDVMNRTSSCCKILQEAVDVVGVDATACSSSEGTVDRSTRDDGWKLGPGVVVTLTVGLPCY
jgi:hypothetical protein